MYRLLVSVGVLLLFGRPLLGAATQMANGPFHVEVDKTTATILAQPAGRPVLTYRFADVPFKPYASQLYTPGGVPVLRDSPADHKHHHALMFAVAVDGVDFWAETPLAGTQAHRKLDAGAGQATAAAPARADSARFTEQLDWLAPDKTVLAREERTIRADDAHDLGVTLVTWRTRLGPAPGKDSIKLTGSHYFGLGVRFAASMDKGGRFITPDGKQGEIVRGAERLVAEPWCAYTASCDGKAVTVALFDDPQNPRHPARMFTMSAPFAYLAATLNLWKEPMTVKAGTPLVLRYGIVAWDGEVTASRIDTAYRRWTALASPE